MMEETCNAASTIEILKNQAAIDTHNATEPFTGILPKEAELRESAEPVNLFTKLSAKH